MDPYLHTFLALLCIYITFVLGKRSARNGAAEAVINYLIQYGACTEDDIERANQRFDQEQE